MKKLALVMSMIIIFSTLTGCNNLNTQDNIDRLSIEEVNSLRDEQFMQIKFSPPMMVDIHPLSLEDTVEESDTFAHLEVVDYLEGCKVYYDKYGNIVEQYENTNEKPKFSYYAFKCKVLADSNGVLKKGSTITISTNAAFKGMQPDLEKGNEIIVPITKNEEGQIDQYSYDGWKIYNVTNDGYAISTFWDSAYTVCSGIKAQRLLELTSKKNMPTTQELIENCSNYKFTNKLSSEKIEKLREEYPAVVDYSKFDEGEARSMSPYYIDYLEGGFTYLRCKVLTDVSNTQEEFSYKVEVIDDSNKILTKGTTLEIANSLESAYDIELKKGMEVIVPTTAYPFNDTGKYMVNLYQGYYVTEDDYAISFFEDSVLQDDNKVAVKSGVKVQELLNIYKKVRY